MFEALKGFLAEFAGKQAPARKFDDTDVRLAAAALLVHVGDADGRFGKRERNRAQALVGEYFQLDTSRAASLIREALERDHEEVSIDSFVTVLKRNLNKDARLKIVAMMWDIVFADGSANDAEDSIVWRIAGMLEVPQEDRDILRRSRIPDELGRSGDGS
jgi:uncharacterized tellurite resistance protein B-like protein